MIHGRLPTRSSFDLRLPVTTVACYMLYQLSRQLSSFCLSNYALAQQYGRVHLRTAKVLSSSKINDEPQNYTDTR